MCCGGSSGGSGEERKWVGHLHLIPYALPELVAKSIGRHCRLTGIDPPRTTTIARVCLYMTNLLQVNHQQSNPMCPYGKALREERILVRRKRELEVQLTGRTGLKHVIPRDWCPAFAFVPLYCLGLNHLQAIHGELFTMDGCIKTDAVLGLKEMEKTAFASGASIDYRYQLRLTSIASSSVIETLTKARVIDTQLQKVVKVQLLIGGFKTQVLFNGHWLNLSASEHISTVEGPEGVYSISVDSAQHELHFVVWGQGGPTTLKIPEWANS